MYIMFCVAAFMLGMYVCMYMRVCI